MKHYRKTFILILAVAASYLLLSIPLEHDIHTPEADKTPFSWNRDSVWKRLELQFISANAEGCEKVQFTIDSILKDSEFLLKEISADALDPSDKRFVSLEGNIFNIAPLVPVCPKLFPEYLKFYSHLRRVVKEQSGNWDVNSAEAKHTLYRLLYGNRIAIEEIMLQLPDDQVAPLMMGIDEPSSTPSANMLGVNVHSGDILVSRGGAPTSALIARGNDYPGNFSHIALVHIDKGAQVISLIESHIERGVTVSSLEEYLNDRKLRIMVLRLRADLISENPMVPHQAAEYSLGEAKGKDTPYDFEMDINESEKQFCSEVASSAYKKYGITLWKGLSTISSAGVRNWLSAFGVRYFVTQEPSDLEYDPQLSVVAEWRDPATLFEDHLDNAVTDVMLEEADSGKVLSYKWYALPIARAMKCYSLILNVFGSEGPVPEGMSAEAALKNVSYSDTHDLIESQLIVIANQVETQKGYTPPYWELVSLARKVRDEVNKQK
jgi:hypothetical protein